MGDAVVIVRQWIETIWNAGDLDQIDRFHPPIFDNEGTASTPTEARAWHAGMRTTFPDIRYQIEDLFAAGDRVTVRWSAQATHQGTLWGFIPPTGKQVEWSGIHIVRVEDDKITEIWAVANQATILQQLGVQIVPAAGEL
ncbi:MAG: ester cyclase [Caldilineaceae bacterium]|nr:ester cyclase [Caldilineaceae bacterium]